MKKVFWTALVLVLAFILIGSGLTQEQKPNMRQEIVKLKYIDKEDILNVLYTFKSPEGRISPSPKSGLLTISDYPENVEKVLEVIRQLDVKPADIQFTIQLIMASTEGDSERADALI
jgi:type II secretory pathway component GspD/PulD (secretin)